ncbi:MAG: molybdopterin-dependent oxidoreductase [Candidatus Firestonebacteria bacterium]|nr:molybdopterin-dependent oxidoreductase [Candidatus Firestonebacteria bacterium]
MIEITINSKKIRTKENRTILEVANEYGIHIPTLCHHPHLRAGYGSCRICAVEITGVKRLLPACVTQIANNMEIFTNSANVRKARKILIELLLLHHPCDCLTCDKSGECALQNLAYEYEVAINQFSRFKGEDREFTIDLHSPVIERNLYRCITCGRCVRVCDEIRGVGAVDYVRRGFDTEINTAQGAKLRCEFCGSCVVMCPVGALTSKSFKYKARSWELTKIPTTCSYCGTGCQIELNVKNNKIYRVTADDHKGINEGHLCIKGRYGYDYVHHTSRLYEPLLRKEDKLVPVKWDEAIIKVSKELERIRDQYGVQSIAGIGSVRTTNEDNYLFQKFFRAVIGNHNVDTVAHYYHLPTIKSMQNTLGVASSTNSLEEIIGANVIIVIGLDVAELNPVVGLKIKKANRFHEAKVIVIGPKNDKLAKFTKKYGGMHIQNKPGTEGVLVAGMCNYLIKENKVNADFIKANTIGYEAFSKSINEWTLEKVSGITGVSIAKIKEIADLFAGTDKGIIISGNEITVGHNAENNILILIDLVLLTGNIGREHAGIIPITEYNNLQGSYDMGVTPLYLPGYQEITSQSVREKFNKLWHVRISEEKGLSLPDMIKAIHEGKLKALYIMGDNLVLPYLKRKFKEAFDMIELIVVQDIYRTESAEFATVVLPSVSFAEKNGTFTNTDRHIQKVNKALDRKAESKTDWEIIANLSSEMGYSMDYSIEADIMTEIAKVCPIYNGVDYKDIEKKGIQWPIENNSGVKTLFTKGFPSDSGRFQSVLFNITETGKNKKYPFSLLIGGTLYHSGTGTMSQKSHEIMVVTGHSPLEINFKDAKELKLQEKEEVILKTPYDNIKVSVTINNELPEGSVFLPFYFAANTNLLGNFLEAGKDGTNFDKICPANIEKIEINNERTQDKEDEING